MNTEPAPDPELFVFMSMATAPELSLFMAPALAPALASVRFHKLIFSIVCLGVPQVE